MRKDKPIRNENGPETLLMQPEHKKNFKQDVSNSYTNLPKLSQRANNIIQVSEIDNISGSAGIRLRSNIKRI